MIIFVYNNIKEDTYLHKFQNLWLGYSMLYLYEATNDQIQFNLEFNKKEDSL